MAFGKCDTCVTLREQLGEANARWTLCWEQLKDMTEKYHALRVAGANPEQERKGLPPASRQMKAADEAIETMMGRWGNNPALRKRLQLFVNMERQKGKVEEAQIAHDVLHWSSPDDEDGG